MKVLFVTSGNSKYHRDLPAFIMSQADSLVDLGITLEFFKIKGNGVKGYLKNILPLRQKLKSQHFDVIHAHYGFCGVVAAIVRRKEKLVVSFMGESEFLLDAENKYKPFLWIMIYLHRLFARHIFDFVIFKSESLASFVKGITNKSRILPNGVNLERFRPIDKVMARAFLNLSPSKSIVLWIGNKNRAVKGYSIAVAAIDKLRLCFTDLEFLQVNDVSNEILPYYYNAADVFLLSSLSEGSPNVVKEAMACNCPVVATDVGDIRKLFNSSKGCKISNSFAPEELSKLVEEVLRSGEKSNGLARIRSLRLDSKSVAEELLSIYSQITE